MKIHVFNTRERRPREGSLLKNIPSRMIDGQKKNTLFPKLYLYIFITMETNYFSMIYMANKNSQKPLREFVCVLKFTLMYMQAFIINCALPVIYNRKCVHTVPFLIGSCRMSCTVEKLKKLYSVFARI